MYGDNAAELRSELATLLQITRNQDSLDALVPDEVALIASFRTGLTVWCQQAVQASGPVRDLGGRTPRSRGPAEELRHRLDQAHTAYTASLPTLNQLAAPHPDQVVDLWRRAAKAAALGEHDFSADLDYGRLTEPQAMTILKDAAEIVRVLVILDRRHTASVTGWKPLMEAKPLDLAAVVCVAHAGYNEPDYSIDHRGWHPPPRLLDGPPLLGFDGVLQAQNNLLVHLGNQPDSHSLRLVFDSQRIVTDGALSVCERWPDSSRWATRWTRRADTYHLLITQARNLRGLVGTSTAAAEGALAAHRTVNLPSSEQITDRQLQHLDDLFVRIDCHLAAIIRAGARDRSNLMGVGIPRIDLVSAGPVKQQRIRHVPLDVPSRAGLLVTATCRLPRPEAPGTRTTPAAPRHIARSSEIIL